MYMQPGEVVHVFFHPRQRVRALCRQTTNRQRSTQQRAAHAAGHTERKPSETTVNYCSDKASRAVTCTVLAHACLQHLAYVLIENTHVNMSKRENLSFYSQVEPGTRGAGTTRKDRHRVSAKSSRSTLIAANTSQMQQASSQRASADAPTENIGQRTPML